MAVLAGIALVAIVVAWIVVFGIEGYRCFFVAPTPIPTRDIDPNSCYGLSTAECNAVHFDKLP